MLRGPTSRSPAVPIVPDQNGISREDIAEAIVPVLERYHVRRSGLFGSYVSGTATQESDVDILVELDDEYSLLDFVRLKHELEEALGRSVDLVEYDALKNPLREQVLNEEVRIYGART